MELGFIHDAIDDRVNELDVDKEKREAVWNCGDTALRFGH